MYDYALLDKLGYDSYGLVQTVDNWTGQRGLEIVKKKEFEKHNPGVCVCPTYGMVAQWLRVKYGIALCILANSEGEYKWKEVFLPNFNSSSQKWDGYIKHPIKHSYDNAISHAVRTILEILVRI